MIILPCGLRLDKCFRRKCGNAEYANVEMVVVQLIYHFHIFTFVIGK